MMDPLNFQGDVQTLLNIARATEDTKDENFSMRFWKPEFYTSSCNTACCMVGNYILRYIKEDIFIKDGLLFGISNVNEQFEILAEKLKISQIECEFLFGVIFHEYDIYIERTEETRLHALTRLRKYIYYKLRKREILGDLNTKEGRATYERARKTEGNHNFTLKALAAV